MELKIKSVTSDLLILSKPRLILNGENTKIALPQNSRPERQNAVVSTREDKSRVFHSVEGEFGLQPSRRWVRMMSSMAWPWAFMSSAGKTGASEVDHPLGRVTEETSVNGRE